MSSLGDLLLAHLKAHKDEDAPSHVGESAATKVFTERVEKNNDEDARSNASSTDDYVRELLDPDDRPKNVWHVVEGPKEGAEDGDDVGSQSPEKESLPDEDPMQKNTNNNNPSESGSGKMDTESQIDDEMTNVKNADEHKVDDDVNQGGGVEEDRRSGKTDDKHRDNSREKSRDRSSRKHRHHDHDRGDRHRDRDRDRDSERNRDGDRHRDRRSTKSRDDYERDRNGHRSRRRHDYSDDDGEGVERRRSRHDRRRSRSRSRMSSRRRERSRSNSQSPITKRNSRTILVMQLNPKVRSHDLEDFFSDIGKVREVRLIMDSKTRRHKGIAYIEFEDAATAAKAFSLSGQKFFGAPVVIQSAQSERNRSSSDWHSSSTSHTVNHASSHPSSRPHLPPNCYRVYVGGLNVNLTEDMIRSVFEPFGPIVRLELMRDRTTNISRGYAFITYAYIEDGQNAVKCLDGFELAGKALRVSKSTDKSERTTTTGTDSNSTGRAGGHLDSDSDGRSSKTKDLTASLYELAGHQSY